MNQTYPVKLVRRKNTCPDCTARNEIIAQLEAALKDLKTDAEEYYKLTNNQQPVNDYSLGRFDCYKWVEENCIEALESLAKYRESRG